MIIGLVPIDILRQGKLTNKILNYSRHHRRTAPFMKIKKEKIEALIDKVEEIIGLVKAEEARYKEAIAMTCEVYTKSARNLIHYQALRKLDLRKLQKSLGDLGMSRLANAEGHVLASLLNTHYILKSLIDQSSKNTKAGLSIKNAKKQLANNAKEILGDPSPGRRVRVMVTQPTESAYNYQLVHDMVAKGMNCARVNCAHDGPEVWQKMIANIHKAAEAQGRTVKIAMDLAGPKIRTGQITPGSKVRKFSPERDEMGRVIQPASILLLPQIDEESAPNTLPVDKDWLATLEVGDKITVSDTRDKERTLKVMEVEPGQVLLNCYDTSYLGTGTVLTRQGETPTETVVGELPAIEQVLLLRNNDLLTVHKGDILGEPAQYDEEGRLLSHAHIGCQLAEVFATVKVGETILFDDGKIEGIIEAVREAAFDVRITRAKDNGAKLKAEKGINFPTTNMGVSGLTAKDKEDLKFVTQYADVVNFSFVNSKADVEELLAELEKLEAKNKLSIILKIETQRAFDNLAEILLASMQVHYIGVMIARGDLAVETGWNNIGWVQNEILGLSAAAHVPVVWATQVLENLAKKGLPSRSEITDATSSIRAECVMLNKGPYINTAIGLLDQILCDMEQFQEKKNPMLPQMHKLLKG